MRVHFLRCIVSFLAVIALFLSSTFVYADEEKHDWVGGLSPDIDTGVESVDIDVFVRDKDDEPRTGLTKDQFRISQDGVNMPITRFSTFIHQSLIPTSQTDSDEPVDDGVQKTPENIHPIYIVLYIDNENLFSIDRNRVLRALQSFTTSIVDQHSQIMVVCHGETTEIVQPFTNDSKEVIHALRYVRTLETSLEDFDDRHSAVQSKIRRAINDRNRASAGRDQVVSEIYDDIRVFAEEEDKRLAGILQSINEVGATLTGINGRKYFVYVSNGLPLVLARDLFHEYAALFNMTSTVSMTAAFNRKQSYDSLAAAANAQAITIHAVDASGPFTGSGSIGDSVSARSSQAASVASKNLQAPLRMLTENTGGLAILNTDDFFEGFARISADLLTYYSIGYEIETSGSDKVHLIDVTLESDQGEQLRFRKAFVEKSIQSKVQEKVNASLFFDIDENPMGVEVTTGSKKPATPDRWVQPFTISFPILSIALVPDGDDYVGAAIVFVASRDFEGRRTDIQRRSHEIRIPKSSYEQLRTTRFIIDLNLLLEKGSHNVAIGVLDETTRRSSYTKIQATIDVDDEKAK